MEKNMMNYVLAFLILLICFFVFLRAFLVWHFSRSRKKGLYPSNGPVTLFDVKRLISSGEKISAVQLYREIYKGVPLKEAQQAVEEMERSINTKRNSSSAS